MGSARFRPPVWVLYPDTVQIWQLLHDSRGFQKLGTRLAAALQGSKVCLVGSSHLPKIGGLV